MTRASFSWRARALALAAVLAVAACQSAPAPTPSPGGTAAATPEPTAAAPTATAAPVDVSALFTEKWKAVDSGVFTFEATVRSGLVQVAMSGNSTFDGPDSRTRISTTVGGVRVDTETVQVAGKRYMQTGSGPWLEVPVTSSSNDLGSQIATAAKGGLKDVGTEQRNGETVHRLEPTTSSFDPSALLGASAAAVQDMAIEMAFFAAEDGTPKAATIEATWKQKVGEQLTDGSMEFGLTFSRLGSDQTIRAPEDVWKAFTSSRYHFRIAHPAEWTYFKAKGADELDAPYYAYVLASRGKAQGFSLNQWAKNEVAAIKAFVSTSSVSNEGRTLGGVQARILSGTGKAKDLGKKVVLYEAVAVKGGFVYFVIWVSEVGHEAEDLALFQQMLGTFAYT